jgi:hypothetical protein
MEAWPAIALALLGALSLVPVALRASGRASLAVLQRFLC